MNNEIFTRTILNPWQDFAYHTRTAFPIVTTMCGSGIGTYVKFQTGQAATLPYPKQGC